MKAPKSYIKALLLVIVLTIIYGCSYEYNTIYNYAPERGTFQTQDEVMFFTILNNHRASLGLHRVKPEVRADSLAGSHVDYMIAQDTISHDFFVQRAIASEAKLVWEVCAFNCDSPQQMFDAYMYSPEHKLVLEDPNLEWVGIVTRYDGNDRSYNCTFFTKY